MMSICLKAINKKHDVNILLEVSSDTELNMSNMWRMIILTNYIFCFIVVVATSINGETEVVAPCVIQWRTDTSSRVTVNHISFHHFRVKLTVDLVGIIETWPTDLDLFASQSGPRSWSQVYGTCYKK